MEINYKSAEEAVKAIKSGTRIFVHGSAATPLHLLKALIKRRHEIETVEIVVLLLLYG